MTESPWHGARPYKRGSAQSITEIIGEALKDGPATNFFLGRLVVKRLRRQGASALRTMRSVRTRMNALAETGAVVRRAGPGGAMFWALPGDRRPLHGGRE